jgi:CMP/dCMP kinase
MSKRIVVAIDGPAGAGKSTIARRVAARLGFIYIDTGAMYRAVALEALREGIELDDAMSLEDIANQVQIEFLPGRNDILINGADSSEAIRAPRISDAASRVSAVSGVRRAMVMQQRVMAAGRSVVMEGRDIGTVVFPDAEVKVFLDASRDIRSERRATELKAKGASADSGQVKREMAERDHRDSTRPDSPLLQAPDAVYVDTSALTLEQVEEAVLAIVRAKTSNGKEAAH